MIKPFYPLRKRFGVSVSGSGVSDTAMTFLINALTGATPDDDSGLAVDDSGMSAVQYAPRTIAFRANDSFDGSSPLFVPQSLEEAGDLYGGKTTDLRYEILKDGGYLTGLEVVPNGLGYKRFEYLFTGNPDNRVPPCANKDDFSKLGTAYMKSMSANAIMGVTLTYMGADITVDDGHDMYELTMSKGDKYIFNWTPRTFFIVDPSDDSIQFQLNGRKLAVQILAASTFDVERLNILARHALVPKFDALIPLGTFDKAEVSSTSIRVVKGTRVFKNAKSEHFIDVDMKVSLEDNGFTKKAIKELVSALTPVAATDKAKIKRVATLTPVVDNEVAPAPVKLPEDPVREVFGAYFAVSPHQLDRSRVIFGASIAEVSDAAKQLVKRMVSPVTITTFSTTNTDPNYKSGVVIKNTNLMAGKYKAIKQLVPSTKSDAKSEYLEPKDNPPTLSIPCVDQNAVDVVNVIKELIGRGYFTREISVLNTGAPDANIQFSFPTPSTQYRDEVVGCMRRVDAWLRKQGVNTKKVSIQYAKTYAVVHMAFPRLKENDYTSCLMLSKNPPMMGTPIYSVKGKEQIVVSATSYNIHTGKVLVTPTRSSTLYKHPFEVSYDQLFQI